MARPRMARETLPADATEAARRMAEQPGSRASLAVERSEQRQREEPGRTISSEALVSLRDQIGLWVGTRIHRRWAESGQPPQEVEVEVNVKLDGSDDAIHETVKFSVGLPDASHRGAAGRPR
jgi:hypothetical protein